jgi:hypothetical protein
VHVADPALCRCCAGVRVAHEPPRGLKPTLLCK